MRVTSRAVLRLGTEEDYRVLIPCIGSTCHRLTFLYCRGPSAAGADPPAGEREAGVGARPEQQGLLAASRPPPQQARQRGFKPYRSVSQNSFKIGYLYIQGKLSSKPVSTLQALPNELYLFSFVGN